jgi:N-ethylmaleimide reductase
MLEFKLILIADQLTQGAIMSTSETKTSHLLSQFDLRGLSLKNRVVMAPLTRSRAGEARLPNAMMAEYYGQRAAAGLIITEATVVSKQGIGWLNSPGIYTDEQAEAWKKLVDAVHAKGAPMFLQLWHCGRASHSDFHDHRELPVAPSPIRIAGDYIHTPLGKKPHEIPRPLETDEIPAIVEDYRRAAARAQAAGFDGVEVHAANGYLIDQFLQSKTNQRTDRYGGTLENRYRFLDEIVRAVLTVLPPGQVGVHLSPNGIFNDMGSPDFRETFLYVAKSLSQYGLAYLHVLDGLAFGFHALGPPMTSEEFRQVFAGPLMANCGYTQETAEEAIQRGHADLISFGRPFISNPDLVERFAHGWPLNPPADEKVWYSFDKVGYTDFPRYLDEAGSKL